MDSLINIFKEGYLNPVFVVLALVCLLFLNNWIFSKLKSTTSSTLFAKGGIIFFLVLVGILIFILVLPIENKTLQGQIVGFLAIIVSAGIALSSTTILGNLIAGIMNNSMKRFRNGDMIKIGDFHGRVTSKSLFHIEIQLKDSNFVTIPNLYIASNPVKLTRKSKTIISSSVSLGYDVPRLNVEKALIDAALATELTDPYVYILSLNDYSVNYKIHGFLEDSSKFFSTSSLLNANVIDKLHQSKIEIVSPTFMNQRRVDEMVFIPKQQTPKNQPNDKGSPEDLVFDEAIKSEKIETKKDYIKVIDKKQEELKKNLKDLEDAEEIEKIKSKSKRNDDLKEQIKKNIEEQIEKDKDSVK